MGEILIAGMASMLICIFLGPKFIEYLRVREFGQHIREDGPQEHHAKAGTPTMGGLIIFASICVPFLVLSDRDASAMAVFGVARAFFGPASLSLLPNLVPQQDFANAVAWNSSAWQTATIVGPVAGGLLYGVSPLVSYGSAALLMLLGTALVFSIPRPVHRDATEKPTMDMMFAGFAYIWNNKVVLGAVSLDMFAVLLSGASALLPVYARDILDLGPWGLGLLRSAPGVGAIAVALFLAGHPIRDRAGVILLTFVGLFGTTTVVFGLSTITWLSIAALAGLGAADMVSVYIRETIIQLWTPDELRGRVNAVNQVFVGASNEIGEFRAGTMAALIGTVPAVVIGGVGAIVVAATWAIVFPRLRKVQHLGGAGAQSPHESDQI